MPREHWHKLDCDITCSVPYKANSRDHSKIIFGFSEFNIYKYVCDQVVSFCESEITFLPNSNLFCPYLQKIEMGQTSQRCNVCRSIQFIGTFKLHTNVFRLGSV